MSIITINTKLRNYEFLFIIVKNQFAGRRKNVIERYYSILPCTPTKTKLAGQDELKRLIDALYAINRFDNLHSTIELEAYVTEKCCKIFRSIFDYGNLKAIFDIMRFSRGLPLPLSLEEMVKLDYEEYLQLLPSNGDFDKLNAAG